MSPTTQAATNSDIRSAYQNGQNLQNQYNAQSGQLSNAYNTDAGNAQNAQSQLQDYTNQIAGQNYGNIYGQDLSSANQMYGVNPQTIQNFQKAAGASAATLANLPQAIQQQGNYYGTTAGSEANNYANLAPQIVNAGAYDNSQLQNQLGYVSAAQNAANQQTTQQLAGQAQALGGYQGAAQNATSIMQQAQLAMNNIETLAQQQGTATASQVADYQNAYNNYLSAQAALSSASAANTTANANMILDPAQAAYYNEQVKEAQNGKSSSGSLSVQPASNSSKILLGSNGGGVQGGNVSLQGGSL